MIERKKNSITWMDHHLTVGYEQPESTEVPTLRLSHKKGKKDEKGIHKVRRRKHKLHRAETYAHVEVELAFIHARFLAIGRSGSVQF